MLLTLLFPMFAFAQDTTAFTGDLSGSYSGGSLQLVTMTYAEKPGETFYFTSERIGQIEEMTKIMALNGENTLEIMRILNEFHFFTLNKVI